MTVEPTSTAPSSESHHSFGDIVAVAPDTLMVVGRHLDLARGQADVANSILYRKDGVVYWVDSGATQEFVGPLRAAFEQLKPYSKVVLVNTHGHADHVGNNALLTDLGASQVEHYISVAEVATMRDQVGYFADGLSIASPFEPSVADARAASSRLIGLFEPLDVESGHLTTLESLPLAEIRVGAGRWTGYELGGGAAQLLRAQGHTAGEVMVYFPEITLLHLADEANSYQPIFPGHNTVLTHAVHSTVLAGLDDVAVTTVTDGHTFRVRTAAQARTLMENWLATAVGYDVAVHRILREHPDGLTVAQISAALAVAPELGDAQAGANPNALFTLLMVTVKLNQLGLIPDDVTDTTRITVAAHT